MNNQTIETTNWLTKGISEEQLKIEKTLSVISAKIYTKRTQMGMDQKAFAKFMGVSQGMVSRWESGTYNFSVTTLIGICEKLELNFEPQIFEKEFSPKNIKFVITKKATYDFREWEDWMPNGQGILGKGVA